jgi:hypothetical protein
MGVVQQVASELGLSSSATEADIAAYCVRKIGAWLDGRPRVQSIAEVQKIVCDRLHLAIVEVRTGADLNRLVSQYTHAGEWVFGYLPADLNDGTYATTYQIKQPQNHSQFGHWVAVIDSRNEEKAARRHFSKWHEIAHLLTMPAERERPYQPEGPDLRALERLMDAVAAQIGFYPPLFDPLLEQRVQGDRELTLGGIERLRVDFCQDASYQATALAAVERASLPCVYLEAAPDPARRTLRTCQVTASVPAWTNGLRISRDTPVPSSSVAALVWNTPAEPGIPAHEVRTEQLSAWRHVDGGTLPRMDARVEARCVRTSWHGCVQALITPTRLRDEWLASLPAVPTPNLPTQAGPVPDPW